MNPRELEQNEGRLRAFYARKIEQLNKRFESQLLALKRGGSATSNPEQNIEDPSKLANDNYKLQVERKELVCRIQMLEDELMRTAEELGRVRNAGEVGKEHARQATDSSSHVSGAIEEQRREIDQLKIEIRTLSDLKSKEALPSVESGIPVSDLNLERLLTDRDGRIRELEARVSDYRAQIDVLSRREAEGAGAAAHLSDLQVRISSLITENAALQMQVKEMSLSPILLQFHVSDSHQKLFCCMLAFNRYLRMYRHWRTTFLCWKASCPRALRSSAGRQRTGRLRSIWSAFDFSPFTNRYA
jgi:chromosome segregation ATPase